MSGKSAVRNNVPLSVHGKRRGNISEPESIGVYEQILADTIKESVGKSVQATRQTYEADIFGLGEHMYRAEPAYFQEVMSDWNNHFREAEVGVRVHVLIRRFGLRSKTLNQENGIE